MKHLFTRNIRALTTKLSLPDLEAITTVLEELKYETPLFMKILDQEGMKTAKEFHKQVGGMMKRKEE